MTNLSSAAGIHVCGISDRCLESMLLAVLSPSEEPDALKQPTAVHRLDYRVSGLLMVAKTRRALVYGGRLFQDKSIRKRYRALLVGLLPSRRDGDSPAICTIRETGTCSCSGLQASEEEEFSDNSARDLYAVTTPIGGQPSESWIRVVKHDLR